MALLFALTLVAFAPTLPSFHGVWMRQPYTHGYLILAATIWLIWRERSSLSVRVPGWRAALPLAGGLSLAWLVAQVASIQMIAQGAVPVLLFLWAAAVFGKPVAARLAPAAGFFLLAVPFWELTTPVLQQLTVLAAGMALSVLRVPATLEGNVVHVPSGSFLIEDGCAGLNYLLAGLVIGGLYGLAFARRWPTRIAILCLAAAISILGNWIRVTALVVIGHVTEMQSGLMAGHLTFGWAIFLVGLFAFFPLARRVETWGAVRWPAPTSGAAGVADRSETSVGDALASTVAEPSSRNAAPLGRAALASAVVACGPILYFALGALPAHTVPPIAVGGRGAGWVLRAGEPVRSTSWRPAFPEPDEVSFATWTNGTEQIVLDRLVYHGQSQEAELVGFGSQIAPDTALVMERLFGQIGPERRLVNEAIVRVEGEHLLVWYWYRVGGVETPSPTRAKLLEVWAFLRRATTSELIAVSTDCGPSDCAEASRALASFMGST